MELCRCIGRFFNDRSRILSAVPDLAVLTVEEVQIFLTEGLCGLPPLFAKELGIEHSNSIHHLFAQRHETITADVDDRIPDINSTSTKEESDYAHIDINNNINADDQEGSAPMQWIGGVTVDQIVAVVRHMMEQMIHRWIQDDQSISCLSYEVIQRCLQRSDTVGCTIPLGRSIPESLSKYCTVVCCEAARTLFYEAQVPL